MNERPTHASVTDIPCSCGYLQCAADDPANPIIFDEQTSEYLFTYQEPRLDSQSTLVIYHCPFCGGAAPASQRHQLFTVISPAEEDRLAGLLASVKTIQQAVDKFGAPQMDTYSTVRDLRRDDANNPPSIQRHRELLYTTLSEVADVRVTELPDGRVAWTLSGKYIGV